MLFKELQGSMEYEIVSGQQLLAQPPSLYVPTHPLLSAPLSRAVFSQFPNMLALAHQLHFSPAHVICHPSLNEWLHFWLLFNILPHVSPSRSVFLTLFICMPRSTPFQTDFVPHYACRLDVCIQLDFLRTEP